MKLFAIVLLLLLHSFSYGQPDCDCTQELDFVAEFYEKNLPSYPSTVDGDPSAYEAMRDSLHKKSSDITSIDNCLRLLMHYVEYFNDKHSSISMSSESNYTHNADTALSKEMRTKLHPDSLAKFPLEDIRGLYRVAGNSPFEIAIVSGNHGPGSYQGRIVNSQTDAIADGKLLIELQRNSRGNYDVVTYNSNGSISYLSDFHYKNGDLEGRAFKKETGRTKSHVFSSEQKTYAKVLNDSVAYLRVHTFNKALKKTMDSVYQSVDSLITSKPYLVIDVRDNGGGSTGNAFPMVKYFYDSPIIGARVEIYVTENNIDYLNNLHRHLVEEGADPGSNAYLSAITDELNRIKLAPLGSFMERAQSGDTIRLKDTPDTPRQVAILYNRNCASSCEDFIYWAQQSNKTVLVGEKSSGTIGYGEVDHVYTPCYKFQLRYTRTRSSDLAKYEGVGIPPDVFLDDSTDWIDQTLEVLSQ